MESRVSQRSLTSVDKPMNSQRPATRSSSSSLHRAWSTMLPGLDPFRVTNPPLEARKTDHLPEQRKTQSLLPPPQNGFLVTPENAAPTGFTHYTQGGLPKAAFAPARRQQSLPSRRQGGRGVERHRQVTSAPSRKQRAHSQGASLPKLNTLVARSRGPGGEASHIVTTNFAGVSTRDQEASHLKSTRFASNWAQVRAENHIDMCTTSPDLQPKRTGHDEDRARDRAAARRYDGSPEGDHTRGGNPRNKPRVAFHSPVSDKENIKPEAQTKVSPPPALKKTSHPSKKKSREEKEKQTIRFVTPEDERNSTHQENVTDTPDASDQYDHSQRAPRSEKKRPEWNNRLALSVPQPPQPPAKSWRRYEAELTHMPAVTSSKQVYKAYTGRSKQQLRERELTEDSDDMMEGQRPSTSGSLDPDRHESEYQESGDPLSKKQHILTRNEAKMYIHLQNVYGSEAYRQQRKEWFFKKLTDVQLQELKQQAADKRRKQQQKEESKRRQQKQLKFVRSKFRREQLHRFRTQYVTSRVLEYERGDRDVYGLPDDYFDDDDDDDVRSLDGVDADQDEDYEDPKDIGDRTNQHDVKSDHPNTDESKLGSIDHSSPARESENLAGQQGKDSARNGPVSRPVEPSKSTPMSAVTDKPSTKPKNSETKTQSQKATQGAHREQPNNSTADEKSKPVTKDKTKTDSQTVFNKDSPKQNSQSLPKSDTNSKNTNNNQANKTPSVPSETKKHNDKVQNSNDDRVATSGDKSQKVGSANKGQTPAKSVHLKSDPKRDNVDKNADTAISNKKLTSVQNTPDTSKVKPEKSDVPQKTNGRDVAANNTTNKPNLPTTTNTTPVADAKDTISSGVPKKEQKDQPQSKNTELGSEDLNKEKSEPLQRNKGDSAGKNKDGKKDGLLADNPTKRTTVTKDSKGRYITTTKNYGPPDPPPGNPKNTGQSPAAKDSADKHAPGKKQPVSTRQSGQTGGDGVGRPEGTRPADSRGQKRKSTVPQPKSEAEQKLQMERKYGKMFKVNTGPSWNPGAKPPKMEGIDTVVVKVTDEKGQPVVDDDGRTRLRKREVKDVVKEAKDQLAVPVSDSPRRRNTKGGNVSQPADIIRPASADTLDFDEDEDEDDEDVFERVRRKYNLQIDSDDDDDDI